MGLEVVDRGLPKGEATMLKDGEVARVFALRALGGGMRRIARELGMARNTVRDWVRGGADREYGHERRLGFSDRYYFWLQSRFQGGVQNGDVLRQELDAMGISVSLRTGGC